MEKLYTWGGRLHLGTESGGTVTTRCGKRRPPADAISFGANVAAKIAPCPECGKADKVERVPVPAWVGSAVEYDEATGRAFDGVTVADLMRIGAAARWSL